MNLPAYVAGPDEFAEVIGATVLPEKCPDCKVWHLFMKPEQGIAFCWGCTIDRRTATLARAGLLKAKLAAKGIVLEKRWEAGAPPAPSHDDERSSCGTLV